MNWLRNGLFLLLSIAAVQGADKDKDGRFAPGPADSYATRQTVDQVTIAAVPYINDEEIKSAFGKANPYREGILPVLVVVQNNTGKAVNLEQIQAEYVTAGRDRIEATPAAEVKYVAGGRRPKLGQSPIPTGSPRISRKKNPLDTWQIEGRAFSARMLPPGESAHGFFYFQAPYRQGARLHVTGLRDAASRKDLFYFEIPLGAD